MKAFRKEQKGFTLIELLVVVIIVAVLAAVGIPLMSGSLIRARASEAEAALGTIRTGARASLAETGSYTALNGLAPTAANIGLAAGDLRGRFFDDPDYTAIVSPRGAAGAATTFCAGVTGNSATSTAPRAGQVASVSRSIDEDGTLYDDATCTGTVLNP